MHPKHLSIKDFSYHLPEEKIAYHPLAERDSSKLLVYQNGIIQESIYQKIAEYIPAGSLLVFNNTKVVEARLLFQKPSGGVIEIFCLEPHEQYADITTAMLQPKNVLWKCLIGGASKWKRGQMLEKNIDSSGTILQCRFVERRTDCFVVELSWDSSLSFAEILHQAGAIPLPPYIKRDVEATDAERYQTVYAKQNGSVAAPTAGLHFTSEIFSRLKEKNIQTGFVTLHVGAGTFKPVNAAIMENHEMHAEHIDVTIEFIENLILNLNNTIVAVGTTSLRTIESLYWMGVKQSPVSNQQLAVGNYESGVSQWEPYENSDKTISAADALHALLTWMKKNKLNRLVGKTQILIAPGYKPRIVNALITNFHQPQSTLLLLVSALIGEDLPAGQAGWKSVYRFALENNYRFLSYGDGNLLFFNR